MRFILLTGMSGAGKSQALRAFDDMGFLCVDNLPTMFLYDFAKTFITSSSGARNIAVVVDVRSGEFFDAGAVCEINNRVSEEYGLNIEILYLEANPEALINRYKETRREHPLLANDIGLQEAIKLEGERLLPVREAASFLIDTSELTGNQLRKRVADMFKTGEPDIRIDILSFGFKRGLPRDADIVMDVRFIPNPFYIDEIKRFSGLDRRVRDYVLKNEITREFISQTITTLKFLLPHYIDEGKRRLIIAVGCTGGMHRSVAIAEQLSVLLANEGYDAGAVHRDLSLEQTRVLSLDA